MNPFGAYCEGYQAFQDGKGYFSGNPYYLKELFPSELARDPLYINWTNGWSAAYRELKARNKKAQVVITAVDASHLNNKKKIERTIEC